MHFGAIVFRRSRIRLRLKLKLGHLVLPAKPGRAWQAGPGSAGHPHMYYVYVIQSTATNRQYVGSAAFIEQRLAQHNYGKVRSTKAYRPYKLVYSEAYSTRSDARKREIQIKKSGKLRTLLKIHGAIV